MYYIYTEGNNNFECEFSQFGIKIRKLNAEEQNQIIKQYEQFYKRRMLINKLLRAENSDRSLYRRLRNIIFEDDYVYELLRMKRNYDKRPVFHKDVSSLFERLMIVEIDESKLKKYIEPADFGIFVKHFFKLSFIYDINIQNDVLDRQRLPFRGNDITPVDEIIIRFLFDDFKRTSRNLLYVSKQIQNYCNIMHNFFNKIKSENIFHFIEILELYNIKDGFPPNMLVNNVLIMESLLIKEDSTSISKDFALKATLLLKSVDLEYSLKACINIFNYLYSVRSDIVHGNTKKLEEDYSKLKSKYPNFEYPEMKGSKMSRRNSIIVFSNRLSRHLLNCVVKLWLGHPEEIEIIKNC